MTISLEVEGLGVAGAAAEIVRDVSLSVEGGRPFTILGETGSGKSLLAQAIMGVLPEGLLTDGRITLNGERIDQLPLAERRAFWGRKLALLPQEPWLALDPSMQSGAQLAEVYRFLLGRSWNRSREEARADLAALGLADADRRWPHQLSGGMAQRVAFAA
ncbi:MAG: ABC transporter ATP-binding protein, partial [Rhodospirillaceae bacterium]|nr:ABC transporter ATP-binding protein [Rhodospirillaceae bacterium]